MTVCGEESRGGGGVAHKRGWSGPGRGTRNEDSRKSIVR